MSGQADADNSARQALFNDLNKGEGVTSRLKKVTSEMQTHKNPDLRAQVRANKEYLIINLQSTVPAKASESSPTKLSQATKSVPEKPPKTELQDHKTWIVVGFNCLSSN